MGQVAEAPHAEIQQSTIAGRSARSSGLVSALGTVPLAVYLLALLVAPGLVLLLYSFWTSGFYTVERVITNANYLAIVRQPIYWHLLVKSLTVGVVCAAITTVFGFIMAHTMTFRMGRWGPRALVLVMATLLSSYIVRVYAWATILGTRGLLNLLLLDLGIIHRPLTFLLYGYFAVILTLVYVYLPLCILPIYAGLQDVDPRVLEASRDLGASGPQTFRRITLPLALPGLRIAFIFAFILTASDYVTPSLVGGLSGQMVGNVIQDQFTDAGNYPLGAALSFALLIGFAAVLAASWGLFKLLTWMVAWLARRGAAHRRSPARRSLLQPLQRIPWGLIVTSLLLLFLLAPLVTVIVFSFNTTSNPGLPLKGLTWHWYDAIAVAPVFHAILVTSLVVAGAAVAGALLLGVPAAFVLARRQVRLRGLYEVAVYLPIAVPGVMIGVALLTTLVFTGLRAGVGPTIAAHILLVVPYVVLVMRTRLAAMHPEIEEAARDLGSSWRRTFRTVTLPLIMPALVGAAILAAAISLDEVTVTNFTIGASATIPVWVYSEIHTELTPSINAIAVMLLAGSLVLMGIAAGVMRARHSVRLSQSLVQMR